MACERGPCRRGQAPAAAGGTAAAVAAVLVLEAGRGLATEGLTRARLPSLTRCGLWKLRACSTSLAAQTVGKHHWGLFSARVSEADMVRRSSCCGPEETGQWLEEKAKYQGVRLSRINLLLSREA